MNQILYNRLIELAKTEDLAAYSEVAPLVGLSMDVETDRETIATLLGEIARHEHENARPMLTALVVHRGDDNNPGEGFFSIAQELGHYTGSRDKLIRLKFWVNQVKQVHHYWASA